jgi:heat shock protein HslJ
LDEIDAGDHVVDDVLSAVAELPPDAVQTGGSTRPEISLLPSDQTFLARRHFRFESAQGSMPQAFHGFGLGFGDEQVWIGFGCSSNVGRGTLRAGRLVDFRFGDSGSLVGCMGEASAMARAQAVEEWVTTFIASEPSLRIVGDRITFTGQGATLVFVDSKAGYVDKPLVSTTWSVNGLIRAGVLTMVPSNESTILFGHDGSVDVDTTCNTGTGRYTMEGDTLTLTEVSYTRTACAEASAQLDAHIRKVIKNGTLTFAIYASRLHLQRGTVGLFALKKTALQSRDRPRSR